jgi:hypothetical protein
METNTSEEEVGGVVGDLRYRRIFSIERNALKRKEKEGMRKIKYVSTCGRERSMCLDRILQ